MIRDPNYFVYYIHLGSPKPVVKINYWHRPSPQTFYHGENFSNIGERERERDSLRKIVVLH